MRNYYLFLSVDFLVYFFFYSIISWHYQLHAYRIHEVISYLVTKRKDAHSIFRTGQLSSSIGKWFARRSHTEICRGKIRAIGMICDCWHPRVHSWPTTLTTDDVRRRICRTTFCDREAHALWWPNAFCDDVAFYPRSLPLFARIPASGSLIGLHFRLHMP